MGYNSVSSQHNSRQNSPAHFGGVGSANGLRHRQRDWREI